MAHLGSFLEFPLPETKPFLPAVAASPFFDMATPAAASFFLHAERGSSRKRPRGDAAPLMQPREHKLISLAHLQKQPAAATGFSLDLDEKPEPSVIAPPSSHSDELAAVLEQHRNDIDRLLHDQAERLRRSLAESWRRQYRALAAAAEARVAQRLKEKDDELQRAARLGAELEERLSRLRAELIAYKSKADADQATAAALHAQLHQLVSAPPVPCDDAGGAEDEESVYIDHDRVVVVAPPPPLPPTERPCRSCRQGKASLVLLPCRHLCLCSGCGSGPAAAGGCPVCRCPVTGAVQCFLP